MVSVSKKEFVKSSTRTRLHLVNGAATEPSKLVQEIPRWIGGLNDIVPEAVNPSCRNIVSGEAERRVMKQQFLEALDLCRRFDVVDHGKNDTSHRVTQRQGVGELPAVNANRPFDVGRDVGDVLDGVRRAVLAVFNGHLIHVSKLSDDHGSSSLEEDLGLQTVHDAVTELQRADQRC